MAHKKQTTSPGLGAPGIPKMPLGAAGSICPGPVPWGAAAMASARLPAIAGCGNVMGATMAAASKSKINQVVLFFIDFLLKK